VSKKQRIVSPNDYESVIAGKPYVWRLVEGVMTLKRQTAVLTTDPRVPFLHPSVKIVDLGFDDD